MNKLKKSISALSVFGLLVVGLSACGGGDQPSATGAPISFQGCEPQSPLIPTLTNEVCGGDILDGIFEGLVSYTIPTEAEPSKAVLNEAESITPNADNTVYTIKIKPGLKFSDGTDITADDYITAWNYGATFSNAQLSGSFFNVIKGYDEMQPDETKGKEAKDENGDDTLTYDDSYLSTLPTELSGLSKVDDLTIAVELSAPNSAFFTRLGYTAFYPVPSEAYASDETVKAQGEKPVSNGAYIVSEWNHNDIIKLVPNPQYSGPNPAQNDGIDYKVYEDENAAYADLQSGNLDVVKQVPANAFETYTTDPGVQPITEPSTVFQSFTIPGNLKHFGEDEEGILRRQAISMAIDRQTIIDNIFAKLRDPAKDFSAPPINGYSASLKGVENITYNAEKAKELWAKADKISKYEDTFILGYNGDSSHKDWVDATINSIKQTLGIKAEGQGVATFAQFREQISKREFKGAFRSGWQADYPHIENYLEPLYSTAAADGHGSNDGDYKNPEFDKLLTAAAGEPDQAKALALYQQAEEILLNDLPAIPLWNPQVNAGVGEKVELTSAKVTFKGTIAFPTLKFKA